MQKDPAWFAVVNRTAAASLTIAGAALFIYWIVRWVGPAENSYPHQFQIGAALSAGLTLLPAANLVRSLRWRFLLIGLGGSAVLLSLVLLARGGGT
jgi:hypothetical protein